MRHSPPIADGWGSRGKTKKRHKKSSEDFFFHQFCEFCFVKNFRFLIFFLFLHFNTLNLWMKKLRFARVSTAGDGPMPMDDEWEFFDFFLTFFLSFCRFKCRDQPSVELSLLAVFGFWVFIETFLYFCLDRDSIERWNWGLQFLSNSFAIISLTTIMQRVKKKRQYFWEFNYPHETSSSDGGIRISFFEKKQ